MPCLGKPTARETRRSHAVDPPQPNLLWEKENNATHPKWLFTWPWCWMSAVSRQLQRLSGHLQNLSCWMRVYFLRLMLFSAYITYTFTLVAGEYDHHSGLLPGKRSEWLMPTSEVGGNVRVQIWHCWNTLNESGTLQGLSWIVSSEITASLVWSDQMCHELRLHPT